MLRISPSANLTNRLIVLFPVLFVLMPRPGFTGAHYLTYAALGFFCLCICLVYFKKSFIDRRTMMLSVLLYSYALAIALSILVNWGNASVNSFFHIAKPFLFLIVLSFGYIVSEKKE